MSQLVTLGSIHISLQYDRTEARMTDHVAQNVEVDLRSRVRVVSSVTPQNWAEECENQ